LNKSDSEQPRPWHTLSTEQACELNGSSPLQGLSQEEAARRFSVHGPNLLAEGKKRGPLIRFFAQFNNVLIYVLLAAALITLALGQIIDSAVIAGVVIINALIGFVQEGKAESALEKIRSMLSPCAQVLRSGVRQEIPAKDLVPGDIVYLAAGDKVPADLRLLQAHNLSTQEAALTGESLAAEKSTAPVQAHSPLGDRSCMAYSSTLVTTGQGMGLVVATGQATEIGRISDILSSVQTLATPLTRRMESFSKLLSGAIVVIAAATFAFGYLVRNFSATEMFMAAVGLAVAAIPEGLPAIMTITLAIGVQRMARRHAIIRKLPVVEALGSVTVICSDKTGTLTRNEMAVQRIVTAEIDAQVSGTGYSPVGQFSLQEKTVEAANYPVLQQVGRVAGLCNDAELRKANNEWLLAGDPTEGALMALAMKMGLHPQSLRADYPRVDIVPFDSDYQFMATLHPAPSGECLVLLKGAPERVLALCDRVQLDASVGPLLPAHWIEKMESMAAQGMRVLAIAEKTRDSACQSPLKVAEIAQGGFALLGLVGMTDPPREEVIASIRKCHTAGITVKMITGDHVQTARAIGEAIGIGAPRGRNSPQEVSQAPCLTLSGNEIDALDEEGLRQAVKTAHVFARATPEHKLRLVQALQAQGHVIVMTGDGVNDTPALKQADVGVAMGKKGSEAAKEVAEMVLADDNFASITAAVEEGRTVYDNLRKALVFILPTNGGQALILVVAILLGLTLPITAVQILWVNMVTAVTLALALAFESSERNIMQRPPRPAEEPLLQPFLIWRIVLVSALLVCGGLGIFLWELHLEKSIETARTAAINALVAGEIAYLFNSRRLTESVISIEGLLGNRIVLWASAALIMLQLLMTYLPAMQLLFGTAAIGLEAWIKIILFGIAVFFLIEIEKRLISKKLSH
jgi:magnesium-transporting ATPase (P-type)